MVQGIEEGSNRPAHELRSLLTEAHEAFVKKSPPMICRCGNCQRELAWPSPRSGFWASPIECPQCGRWYFSECHNEAGPQLRVSTRLPGFGGWLQQLAEQQLPSIRHVMRVVTRGEQQPQERRQSIHYSVRAPLVAVPLDKNARVVGEAQQSLMLSISEGGAELLSTRPLSCPLLLLDFAEVGVAGMQIVARFVWERKAEDSVRTGCEFLHPPGDAVPFE